jgi:hypothetical protein
LEQDNKHLVFKLNKPYLFLNKDKKRDEKKTIFTAAKKKIPLSKQTEKMEKKYYKSPTKKKKESEMTLQFFKSSHEA